MKHYGDITKLSGYDLPIVDVITGGSPCQDLSVAGKRAGLAGERSGLFMEQVRIVKEMRDASRRTDKYIRPRYMVWENVPGALSSNNGKDFQAVLTEIARIVRPDAPDVPLPERGGWSKSGCLMGYGEDGCPFSIAYRIHDAQFWGVPQRRRRIALVADFGGLSAPEICFEREGLCGSVTEKPHQEQTASEGIGRGTDTAICIQGNCVDRADTAGCNGRGWTKDVSYTINTVDRHAVCFGLDHVMLSGGTTYQGRGPTPSNELSPAITARAGMGGNNVPVVQTVMVEMQSTKNTIVNDGISPTLTARMGTGGNQVNAVLDTVSFGFDPSRKAEATGFKREVAAALVNGTNPGHHNGVLTFSQQRNDEYKESYCAHTQAARDYKSATDLVSNGSVVRRLTPLECERLQGFPDGWTDIGDWVDSKGKKHSGDSDSPRYKALGNSIALPFWKYLARRICAQYERDITMGSLFDGIGGFPLAFERCGAKAVWASEIEEFPIAVTKKHFGKDVDIQKYL